MIIKLTTTEEMTIVIYNNYNSYKIIIINTDNLKNKK